MCVAMNGTIFNPAISPKIKIWTAAIIINFILKQHILQTYQCRVLHENIKNYQYVCNRNDSRSKVIKNVSIQYTYQWWNFQALKNDPGSHPFCKHISSNGDVINGDVIKTKCWKFREMLIYVTKYEWKEFKKLRHYIKNTENKCSLNHFRGFILSVILNYKEWREFFFCFMEVWKKKNLITLLYETASRFHSVISFFFFSYLHETKKILYVP